MIETIERVYTQVERRRKNWKEHAEYVSLRREIGVAAEMQKRFLPKAFPDFKKLDVFAQTRPAKDVGGDFFDVISLNEDREQYGVDRLAKYFSKNTDQSAEGIVAAIFHNLKDHTGTSERSDDITVCA